MKHIPTQTIPIKAIYVEDNPDHLHSFGEILQQHPHFHYLGGFSNSTDALQYLNENSVDVLFLDIEMDGYNGLWLANEVKEMNLSVIFVTAYAKYAALAFEACAIDYLVKPILEGDIDNMLERINLKENKKFFSQEKLEEFQYQFTQPHAIPKRIFINFVSNTQLINLSDVLYFRGMEGYTHIVTSSGVKHVSSKSLKIYAAAISCHPDFLRIHRSSLINKNYVSNIVREKNDQRHSVKMADGEVLEISRFKKDELMRLLSY